ncbi:hypothetical protein PZ938_07675 [Luteipulveratus sp. YIM 133132]|uniref:hypothetical protein n=1 Tax=Luteipulveratus flavus TaxID=3031728 RepID=UPI0023B0776A|nr:hypothetical protein [Luteipulveratus sp. YIM 133132]MDE9365481.1 hypothetical protein [Luteipulveratus sp. YIM 133132]
MRSRMWRRLGATESLFYFYSAQHGAIRDDRLCSITLTRGSDVPVGLSNNLLSVKVRGALDSVGTDNTEAYLVLTDYAMGLLSPRIGAGPGGINAAPMSARWSGRIAGQTVTDTGTGREPVWSTEIAGTDWLSLLPALEGKATMTKTGDTQLLAMYRSLLANTGLRLASLDARGSLFHHLRWISTDPASKDFDSSTVLGHFLADLGYLMRTRRDSIPQVISTDYQASRQAGWKVWCPLPLQRSQCLAPVSWSQPVTLPRRLQYLNRDTANENVTYTSTITVGTPSTKLASWPTEVLDFRDVYVYGSLTDAMVARASRAASDRYIVRSVRVDVLALFESPDLADRQQLAQLLLLDAGDPITLGYDWPVYVRRVYFASRITETITPDGWTLDIDLTPGNHITGQHSPADLAGTTWDTAYPAGTTWDTPPASKTWSTAP